MSAHRGGALIYLHDVCQDGDGVALLRAAGET